MPATSSAAPCADPLPHFLVHHRRTPTTALRRARCCLTMVKATLLLPLIIGSFPRSDLRPSGHVCAARTASSNRRRVSLDGHAGSQKEGDMKSLLLASLIAISSPVDPDQSVSMIQFVRCPSGCFAHCAHTAPRSGSWHHERRCVQWKCQCGPAAGPRRPTGPATGASPMRPPSVGSPRHGLRPAPVQFRR